MFRTIFSRLMIVFICILLVSYSITGVMLYYFVGDFVSEERVVELEESAEKIVTAFDFYYANYDNPIAASMFEMYMEAYSNFTDSYVWIVEKDGRVFFSKPALPRSIVEKYKDEAGFVIQLPDKRQYEKIMSGKTESVKEIGDFFGFFSDKAFEKIGNSWLTVQKPIYSKSTGEVEGAVFFHTPIPEVQRVRTSVLRFFTISMLLSALISIALVYVFSQSISRPLKQIRNAARVIAGGEFQKRLDIKSRDEIGALATSFNQMASALQNLEELRRGFIANVSHELRTPMTSIRGFVEGILDGTIPPEKQGVYLRIVRDETDRLNRLVNELLDLARMESGEFKLNTMDFDINEVIRRCIIKLENHIVIKNISVKADFELEKTMVNADPDAIERVLINLLHNAVKFTGKDGMIRITTIVSKSKVQINVEDNGIGMAKEELDRIWDRFYKSDKSRGMDKTGTGLGLAIIKNIINEHHQEIWVESEIGKGTRFSFTLDRAKE